MMILAKIRVNRILYIPRLSKRTLLKFVGLLDIFRNDSRKNQGGIIGEIIGKTMTTKHNKK